MDPWHKMFLGWINPEILKTASDFTPGQRKTVVLNSSEDRPPNHHPAVVLANPGYRGEKEYFILEYRSKNSSSGRDYDTGIRTDGGLVIWQVDNWHPNEADVQPRNFAYSAGGWRNNTHVRHIADINGDQIGDIIGFGTEDVFVMQGEENEELQPQKVQFGPLAKVLRNFTANAGSWKTDKHVRVMGDVNGDGKDDIIGFGQKDVFVSLSTSTVQRPSFTNPQVWYRGNYTYEGGGWRVDKHVRTVADVNGDGRADIIGFGQKDVFVSLAHSTQNRFLSPQVWYRGNFAYESGGWRVDKHVRTMADVNGDGRADIIGFGQKDVFVSLAHSTQNRFLSPQVWYRGNYTYEGGNWRVDKHERMVADVNGDGRADIVGFGQKDIFVSLAHSTQNRFLSPQVWLENQLTYEGGGWRISKHVRTVTDINNDGKADLVGFGEHGVHVRIADPDESRFLGKMNMRKVFTIAPNQSRRSNGNKMGLYGGDDAFKREDGKIELKWLNGRPAFSIEIIRQPTSSSIEIQVQPDRR